MHQFVQRNIARPAAPVNHFFVLCTMTSEMPGIGAFAGDQPFQRRAASVSLSRDATQVPPWEPSSFFQKGARVFR